MSAAPTERAERAERLISEAERGSMAWAARNDRDELAGALHQIEMLEHIIRSLCSINDSQAAAVKNMGDEVVRLSAALVESRQTVDRLSAASRAQGERLQQLEFDRSTGDDDFDAKADELQRRIAEFNFNRSTGAAAALQGGQR